MGQQTDEVMQMVIQHGFTGATLGRMHANGSDPGAIDRMLQQQRGEVNAIAKRLTEIEQELEGYREDRRTAKAAGELFLSTLTGFDGNDLG